MDRTSAVIKQVRAAEAQAEAVQDLAERFKRLEAKVDRLLALLEAQPEPPKGKGK